MKIEFFHDVICSFCFPMSYRMRQLKADMPELEIVHRSFALVKTPTDFIAMFGSREQAKTEIMSHWKHANQNDDLHRFNIEGMKKESFLFPTSMNGLIAVKAAEIIEGSNAGWDLFDALQKAFFVENKNIESPDIIKQEVVNLGLDLNTWEEAFQATSTKTQVEEDFNLANNYSIKSIPTLIVNGKYEISGAQPLAKIKDYLKIIHEKENTKVVLQDIGGESCNLEDGKWNCD
ncbi:DsbA family oxidoreductase [Carnobacterium sp.]|uniref:DsbA family oxidoreductase n=2 Tax=Carnobacterium sp. TaxID=48221 RepID=UPI002FCC5A3B